MNDVGDVYDDELEVITYQSDLEPTMKRWQELEPSAWLLSGSRLTFLGFSWFTF